MFVVHCSGLLGTSKTITRASRRLFGPGEARKTKRLLTNKRAYFIWKNLLRTVPFVPPVWIGNISTLQDYWCTYHAVFYKIKKTILKKKKKNEENTKIDSTLPFFRPKSTLPENVNCACDFFVQRKKYNIQSRVRFWMEFFHFDTLYVFLLSTRFNNRTETVLSIDFSAKQCVAREVYEMALRIWTTPTILVGSFLG